MGGAGLTVPVLSIDTARAADAVAFARTIGAPTLDDVARDIERIAAAAALTAGARPAPDSLAASAQTLRDIADFLDMTARAATHTDRSSFGTTITDAITAAWNGGGHGFPYGQAVVGGLWLIRTGRWMLPHQRGPVPVFTNGWVGEALTSWLQRHPGTAPAGRWLAGPQGTMPFRAFGVVGAGIATVNSARDVWQQGHPIDAFEREGAGYVADVAGTAFSASTAVFLLVPHPYVGAVVITFGSVWLGAEVWDAWGDEIASWIGDRVDEHVHLLAETASAAWDAGSTVFTTTSSATSDASDACDRATDGAVELAAERAGDIWDAGAGAVDDIGGAFARVFGRD